MPPTTARVRARTDRRVDRHVDRGAFHRSGCVDSVEGVSHGWVLVGRTVVEVRSLLAAAICRRDPRGSGDSSRGGLRLTTHAVAAFIVAECFAVSTSLGGGLGRVGHRESRPYSAHRPNDAARARASSPLPCLSRRACVPRQVLRPMGRVPNCSCGMDDAGEKSQANAVDPAASEVRAMTILILGGDDDEHAMHMLDYLQQRGHDAELFDSRHFPAQMQLSFDPRRGTGTIRLPGGRALDIRRVRSVYWRVITASRSHGWRIPSRRSSPSTTHAACWSRSSSGCRPGGSTAGPPTSCTGPNPCNWRSSPRWASPRRRPC